MSYHRKPLALAGNVGPQWYRALEGVTSQPPGRTVSRRVLGSLGDDAPPTTLSQPTLTDPATAAWQQKVIAQLEAGVKTMQTAELQKWLQIVATISIPLSAAIWKAIFKRGVKVADVTSS